MTRRVALLGKPLKRRHSQVMHDAAFDAAGIDGRYVLRELDEDDVEAAVAEARGPDWLGLGVTAPYKQLVAGLCDEVEARRRARSARSTTSPARPTAGWSASTPTRPGSAPASSWRSAARSPASTWSSPGAGGAAHAVVFACLTRGVRRLTIGNRNGRRGRAPGGPVRRDRVRHGGGGRARRPGFAAALRDADLAVNATTVGMLHPGATIDVSLLPDHATVFDLVYVPPETPLLAAARARGLRAANGSEMLIAQAAIAFERWTGVGGMADVMRTAVAPLLADAAATA